MGFGGFNAVLSLDSKELAVSASVKFGKADAKDLRTALDVVMRSMDSGKLVKRGAAVNGQKQAYEWRYFDESGTEVSKDRIKYYANVGGKEQEVKPFKRTTKIQITKEISAGLESEFVPEAVYELWSDDDTELLFRLAKYLEKNKTIAIANFSFGNGFKQSFALIKPVFMGDSFVLTMTLAMQRKDYKHLMPVAVGEAKEAVPTLDKLLCEVE